MHYQELNLTTSRLSSFRSDLDALYQRAKREAGDEDIRQLKTIIWISRVMTVIGFLIALHSVNILAVVLLSLGAFARWTMVAHHVLHRGYDQVEGVPASLTSRQFAKGFRRFLDWPDWLYPPAWHVEHNILHHYSLNESKDPDLFVENIPDSLVTDKPRWLRLLYLVFFSITWKFVYYAPSAWKQYGLRHKKVKVKDRDERLHTKDILACYGSPVKNKDFYRHSLLPVLLKYTLVPLVIWFFLGGNSAGFLLVNLVLAELLTNLHSFVVIVTNHAGTDLYRYETPSESREEYYLRQVLSSVNFKTGGFFNDFMHGWLNYQIEHHLFPDLSMRRYQVIQPEVEGLCRSYGIPYVQQSVFKRILVLLDIYGNDRRFMKAFRLKGDVGKLSGGGDM